MALLYSGIVIGGNSGACGSSVPVAGPFTQNSTLCDSAPGYAQGSVVIPAPSHDLPLEAEKKGQKPTYPHS